MQIKNLTPHDITVSTPQGDITFRPETNHAPDCPRNAVVFNHEGFLQVDLAIPEFSASYGETNNLPSEQEGVILIVSSMVLEANKGRKDLRAPATGHKDAVRNEKGHILTVPGLVKNL